MRLDKWAEILVHYCLEVGKGQQLLIQSDMGAMPLVEASYRAALKAGAYVELLFNNDATGEYFLNHAGDEQLERTSRLRGYAVEEFDRFLFIYAPSNLLAGSSIPLERHRLVAKANEPIMKRIMERKAAGEIRWCRTHYPTAAAAQNAAMGTAEFADFVYAAALLDTLDPVAAWRALGVAQQRAIDFLSAKKELHFVGSNGTDLLVNIAGMRWVNLCGTINFPDGEIFTGPNLSAADGGVNGRVKYDFPTLYRGVEVEGIELVFERGAVVEAKASRNEAFLKAMIFQDPGAKYVGELALGTNYRITRGVKDILFDEKIGGTFHTALGMGYPETGNSNISALHWDLVSDLRSGGVIYADGEKIFADGRYLLEGWPSEEGP